ncbi:MAG: AsmA family protein [Rhodovibrionaceae bacterium]|nr:AsmA family protein [Rhodovibrionaceae bacterium]
MKLKWILTALLAIVVAVIVAGYIAITQIDPEAYRAEIETEAEKAIGRKLTLAGPMDLKVSLTPAITIEDVSLANASWGSREQMVTLKRLEVEMSLVPLISGDIKINRIVLLEPDILLEVNKQGQANWSFEGEAAKAAPKAEEKPAEATAEGGEPKLPEITSVRIEKGLVTYRDLASGQETRLALGEFTGKNNGLGTPLDIAIGGSYQDVPFEFSGTVGAVTALTANQPYPLDLKGSFAGAAIALTGEIASPMSGPQPSVDFSVEGDSLAAFNPIAGGGLPPLGPYSLSGKLGGSGDTYKITGLAAKVGGSDLSGDVTLAMGGARPAISGSLASELLDMADFSGEEGEGGEDKSADGSGGGKDSKYVFTEDPLPLEGLRAADVDLGLKIAKLRLDEKMVVSDIDLPVKLKGGDLALGPAKAGISEGTVDLNLNLAGSRSTPTMDLALAADGIDYGKLLRKQEVTKDVEGTIGGDIKLSGAGTTPRSIASGLNGKVEIIGDEGVITNKLLAVVSAGLSEVMGPLLGDDKDSKLNCVVARFNVKNGVATSKAILLDTSTFTVAGDGKIDLRTEEPDLYFDTESRKASIASLAVPFRVGGTLKSIKVTPDPVGTALGAAKAAGVVVNPLVGLGVIVAEEAAGEEENPCVAALEGGSTAVQVEGDQQQQEQQPSTGQGTVEDAVKGATEGIEKGIKSLFGD